MFTAAKIPTLAVRQSKGERFSGRSQHLKQPLPKIPLHSRSYPFLRKATGSGLNLPSTRGHFYATVTTAAATLHMHVEIVYYCRLRCHIR